MLDGQEIHLYAMKGDNRLLVYDEQVEKSPIILKEFVEYT